VSGSNWLHTQDEFVILFHFETSRVPRLRPRSKDVTVICTPGDPGSFFWAGAGAGNRSAEDLAKLALSMS